MFFINDLLNRGYAVAITDMEGLGTPGVHTYEVGKSQGKAVLNMARAAERLSGSGVTASSPVAVWGYSQGGTSAGWAAELAASYAPELRLKGVVAGGVPADLNRVAQSLDGSAFVAFALLAALGYDTAYPELNLSSYLNANGQQLMANASSLCLVSFDGIKDFLGTAFHHISDYTTTNPLTTTAWQTRLNQNKLGSSKPTVPVLQVHAQFDEIIPFDQALALRNAWCAKGANVTWSVYPLAEHALGLVEAEPQALQFLGDRFAGRTTSGNCGT
jgi:pimeloyl-ACP methyl ester carboxylesterase